eukprot:g16003.t1
MKTYSRRNSRPISRSGKKGGSSSLQLSPSTPSSTRGITDIPGRARTSSSSSFGNKSTFSSTTAAGQERAYDQQPPSSPSSSPPPPPTTASAAAAVSLENKRRRLFLASVPVCSLSKLASPSPTPAAPSSAGGALGRPSSGSTGGRSAGRGGASGESGGGGDGGGCGGSPSFLGVRRLWGAGDSLSVGRKRRRPGVVKTIPTALSVHNRRQQGSSGLEGDGGGGGGAGRGGVSKRTSSSVGNGKRGAGKEQTFLDFGQRSLGQRILCPRCNLLYVCGSADDEARHSALCAKAARGVDFAGWKQERVKARFADDGGRVVEIRHGDPAPHLAKLREVESLMDGDMGFAPGGRDETVPLVGVEGSGSARKKKRAVSAFLYVRQRRVMGCVIAERIQSARRAVLLLLPVPEAEKESGARQAPARAVSKAAGGDPAANREDTAGEAAGSPPVVVTSPATVVARFPLPSSSRRCGDFEGGAAQCGAATVDAEGPAAAAETSTLTMDGLTVNARKEQAATAAADADDDDDDVASSTGKHSHRQRGGQAQEADDGDDVAGALAPPAAAAAPRRPSLPPPAYPVGPLTPSRAGNTVPPLRSRGEGNGGEIVDSVRRAAAAAAAAAGSRPPSVAQDLGGGAGGRRGTVGTATPATKSNASKKGGCVGASRFSAAAAVPSSSAPSAPSSRLRPPRGLDGATKAGGTATTTLERFWLPRREEEPRVAAAPSSAASCIASLPAASASPAATSFAVGKQAAAARAAPENLAGQARGAGLSVSIVANHQPEDDVGGREETGEGSGVPRSEEDHSERDAGATSARDHRCHGGGVRQDLRDWCAGRTAPSVSASLSPPPPPGSVESGRDTRAAEGAGTGGTVDETRIPWGGHARGAGASGATGLSEKKPRSPVKERASVGGGGSGGSNGSGRNEGSGASNVNSEKPDVNSEKPKVASRAGAGAVEARRRGENEAGLVSSAGGKPTQGAASATKARAAFVRASPWSRVPVAARAVVGVAAVAGSTARKPAPIPPSIIGCGATPVETEGARCSANKRAVVAAESSAAAPAPATTAAGGAAPAPPAPATSTASTATPLAESGAREESARDESVRDRSVSVGAETGSSGHPGGGPVTAGDDRHGTGEDGGRAGDGSRRTLQPEGPKHKTEPVSAVDGRHSPPKIGETASLGVNAAESGESDRVRDGKGIAGSAGVSSSGSSSSGSGGGGGGGRCGDDGGSSATPVTSATTSGAGEQGQRKPHPLPTPPPPPPSSPSSPCPARERRRPRSQPRPTGSSSRGTKDSEEVEDPTEEDPPPVLTCEDEETPAVVGVLQVWVHEQCRRQGIATRLVDAVREKMVYGITLRRDQIAFSQPTREGQAFATRYTGGKLLVY